MFQTCKVFVKLFYVMLSLYGFVKKVKSSPVFKELHPILHFAICASCLNANAGSSVQRSKNENMDRSAETTCSVESYKKNQQNNNNNN